VDSVIVVSSGKPGTNLITSEGEDVALVIDATEQVGFAVVSRNAKHTAFAGNAFGCTTGFNPDSGESGLCGFGLRESFEFHGFEV
jgi:hypothetical protein